VRKRRIFDLVDRRRAGYLRTRITATGAKGYVSVYHGHSAQDPKVAPTVITTATAGGHPSSARSP